jgi:hypothetical protein
MERRNFLSFIGLGGLITIFPTKEVLTSDKWLNQYKIDKSVFSLIKIVKKG